MEIVINNDVAYECKYHQNYFVTKSGKIYSIYVIGGMGRTDINHPHELSYGVDKNGYFRVVLCNNGIKRYVKVHTIVCEQFIGDVVPPMVVNHKDGNKQNNNVDNLEIVTPKQNTIHAVENQLTKNQIPVCVEKDGEKYIFNNMAQCNRTFPDLQLHYLRKIKNGINRFSMILFVKDEPDKKYSTISTYYNGQFFKKFNSQKDAAAYWDKDRKRVYSALHYNEYRKTINQYIVTFPNVSTIENTAIAGSE